VISGDRLARGLVEAVLQHGHNLLLVNIDRLPEPIAVEPVTVITRDNLMEACCSIARCGGRVYRDPDRLLDPAYVDKMIVI